MDQDLVDRALGGDPRALARVISRVEAGGEAAVAIARRIHPRTGGARRIGLTGAPGVGKSTLVDGLAAAFRARGQRVAVVAVDPTSPFTGGAILGDRIRMDRHFADPGVFIRSMATRGHLGGVAATTADVIDVLDAAGYPVVLVETIGVGQDAVEVARLVDCCLLVLTPSLGDDIQAMKGGLMEIGDVYVVNKADLPGVERMEAVLEATLELGGLKAARPVVRTVAASGDGLAELVTAIDDTDRRLGAAAVARRRRDQCRRRIESLVEQRLAARVRRASASGEVWAELGARVERREIDPHRAAAELLERAGIEPLGEEPC